jgi:hypothetical protein
MYPVSTGQQVEASPLAGLKHNFSSPGSSAQICRRVRSMKDLPIGSHSTKQIIKDKEFETSCATQAKSPPPPKRTWRKVRYEATVGTISERNPSARSSIVRSPVGRYHCTVQFKAPSRKKRNNRVSSGIKPVPAKSSKTRPM